MKNKLKCILIIFLVTLSKNFEEITFHSIQDFALYMVKRDEELEIAQKMAKLDVIQQKFAIRDFFPTINFSYSDANYAGSSANDKKLDIYLRQNIFDGGKHRLNFKLNSALKDLAVKDVHVEQYNFYKNIIESYFEIVLLEKKIAIQKNLLKTLESNLEILESKEKLGFGIALDSYNGKIDCLEASQVLNEYCGTYELHRKIFEKELNIAFSDFFIEEEDLITKKYEKKYDGKNVFFSLVKENDLQRKKDITLLAIEKEIAQWNKRKLLPLIALFSTVSFSGKNFPLTEPNLQVGLEINFENNFFPGSVAIHSTINKKQTEDTNSSINFDVLKNVSFFMEEIESYYEFLQREITIKNYEDTLENKFLELLQKFNSLVDSLDVLKEKIKISKKKCDIEKRMFLQGKLTASDYDKSLFALANYEIELFSILYELELLEIEIRYSMQGKGTLYE